jgi:hypothetical protein
MAIPWAACERCASEARAQYQSMMRNSGASYDWIYLQDRLADQYHRYEPATGRKRVL